MVILNTGYIILLHKFLRFLIDKNRKSIYFTVIYAAQTVQNVGFRITSLHYHDKPQLRSFMQCWFQARGTRLVVKF